MLALQETELRKSYIWRESKESGIYRKHFLLAVNLSTTKINGVTNSTEWRVSEDEFLRWLDYHKLWIIDDASVYPVPMQDLTSGMLTFNEDTATVVDIIIPSTEVKNDQSE
jgi:hypothetical protein